MFIFGKENEKQINMFYDISECKCECVRTQSVDPIIILALTLGKVALGVIGLNMYRDKTKLVVIKQQGCAVNRHKIGYFC